MTLVLRQNVRGLSLAPPVTLDRRRRRLSTIVARHGDCSRPLIVSVHRRGGEGGCLPTDDTVRLRATWRDTLVGPDDVVAITTLPLGGGAGGRQQGKQIGMAVGMLALAIAMPYAIGALGVAGSTIGSLSFTGKLIAAGLTAGIAVGASYLLNRAAKTKDKDGDDKIYGVSGGGNLPRPGERIPRLYGRAWIEPDLSQPPYIVNVGEDQDLYQRMTLTLGYCSVETIKVGDAVMWTRAGGVQPAFAGAQVEFIEPGQTSDLVPAAVISSQSVTSQELPRPDAVLPWTGPFPLTPVGRSSGRVQLDYSLPQGVFSTFTNKTGSNTGPMQWGVEFQIAECDEDDNPVSGWSVLYTDGGYQESTKPLRFTRFVSVDASRRYLIRARNTAADSVPGNPRVTDVVNAILWDGMRAWLPETIVRPHVTELAIRVRSGKALGVTAFNAIKVEAIARLPVWTGGEWFMQETRKAIDAFSDIMRGTVNGWTYGAGCADSDLDLDRILFYRNTLTTLDTFDGVIRGPVSVYEAAETVLGVIRAQPARLGNAWSLTRDEPRLARKHAITRRQIVRGTSASEFDLSLTDGAADVVVEYTPNADPARRGEAHKFFGTPTITPRRYQMAGVSSHEHAHMLATWLAASAYFRRERRSFTTELEGRLMRRGDPALVDAWFMGDGARAAGVMDRAGYVLTLDADVEVTAESYMYVRDRVSREFGPVRVTQGPEPNIIVANADDVASVGAFYDPPVAWGDLWQADGDEMTSVLIGPLVEIAEPYLIRSVEPQGRFRVNVEAIADNPQVWTALGEVPPPQPPVPGVEDILGPTVPVVPWVRAYAFQTSTALNMEWSVGEARSAARYVVEVSYDDWATSDLVSDGPAASGSFPIRHVEDQDVYIRAYAISATGVVGPRVFSSFRTFKPIISSDIASILIEMANLQEQLRKDIKSISDTGEDTIRRALMDLNDRVEQLAADAMAANVAEDELRVSLAARVGKTIAAINQEMITRADDDEALAQQITTLLAQLGDVQAAISTEATARATEDSALADLIVTLDATVASNAASATSQITAIADEQGAQATQIGNLQTTVDGHAATLTTYATSIDGMSVQWGVTGTIDGVTGGFVLNGVRRMDGTVAYTVGISGDLIVNQTIYGSKLAADNIITASAQIGNLTVDNIHIRNGAITQVVSSSGDTSASVGINLRGTGAVIIQAYYRGTPGTPRAVTPGALVVRRNGVQIDSLQNNYFAAGSSGNLGYYTLQTTLIVRDAPGAGYVTYQAEDSYGGGVNIVVMEASK